MNLKKTVASITLGAVLTGGAITAAAVGLGGFAGAQTGSDPTATVESEGGQRDPGARLDAALAPLVADGTLTQAQADAVSQTLLAAAAEHQEGRQQRRAELLDAAAEYFGMSSEELSTAWQSGQSLADIAADAGRTREELVDTLVGAIGAKAEAAAAAGTITDDQAQRIVERAPQLVERLVDVPGGSLGGPRDGALRERIADRIGER